MTPVAIIIPGADFELMIEAARETGYNWLNFCDKWSEQVSGLHWLYRPLWFDSGALTLFHVTP